MAKLNVFTLENLSLYDSLIKQYINAGDAKSIKSVSITGRTVKFFRDETPVEGATPDFSVTIPEQDLTAIQDAIKANEDAIKAINDPNTGILVTAKAYTDEKVKALADGAVKDNADAIDALEGRADALEGRATDLEGRADDLETTVNRLDGNAEVAGSVKAQIAAAKTELEGKITNSMYNDEELRGLISANADAAKKAQDEVDALEEVVAGMYTNEAIDTAVAAAKKAGEDAQKDVDALEEAVAEMYTNDDIDGFVAGVQKEVDDLEGVVSELAQTVADNETDIEAKVKAIADDYLTSEDKEELEEAIQDNADAIQAHKDLVDAKVTTLIGEDTGKSVREIANEELIAQIIPEAAKESLDTLEEIAAWIQSHPEDASAMNKAIEDLEKLVGTLPEDVEATTIAGYVAELVAAEKARAEGIEGGLADRIADLETAVGEGGSVGTQIADAIAELDADVTSAAVEAGKGMQVQVVEVDGKITNVAVTGNFDNTYDAKGSATTAETNAKDYAKDYADGLAGNYDAAGSASAAETAAKEHANGLNTAMDSRVTIVEGLVGEGYQAIPDSEINALFA